MKHVSFSIPYFCRRRSYLRLLFGLIEIIRIQSFPIEYGKYFPWLLHNRNQLYAFRLYRCQKLHLSAQQIASGVVTCNKNKSNVSNCSTFFVLQRINRYAFNEYVSVYFWKRKLTFLVLLRIGKSWINNHRFAKILFPCYIFENTFSIFPPWNYISSYR